MPNPQSIVGFSNNRAENDAYFTLPSTTQALLERELFLGNIWEPACGDGAISEELYSYGYEHVISTDIVDYGYKHLTEKCDFLYLPETPQVDNIITNPPFVLAEEFLLKSLECVRYKVALLLKLVFLEGIKRQPILKASPLQTVYVFSKRINFRKGGNPAKGSPMIAYAWFVWNKQYDGPPTLDWI